MIASTHCVGRAVRKYRKGREKERQRKRKRESARKHTLTVHLGRLEGCGVREPWTQKEQIR